MFNEEKFMKLHSLWDGCTENTEVCRSCGLCCDRIEKLLFPGEYEFLEKKTRQKNISWNSKGCLCNMVGFKAIICKLYPLSFIVDAHGYKIRMDKKNNLWILNGYTDRCFELKYDMKKIKKFCDYLFSDIDNRMFYGLVYTTQFIEEDIIEENKKNKVIMKDEEVSLKAINRLFGIENLLTE